MTDPRQPAWRQTELADELSEEQRWLFEQRPCPEGLDPEIERYVRALLKHGIDTFESCQGGEGHATAEPMVRFDGDETAGFQALDIARKHGFPVLELRRVWAVFDGEPDDPYWEFILRA